MASIYKPKDKLNWYISFVDPATGKVKSRSTGLRATKENLKKVKSLKLEIEESLRDKLQQYTQHNIKRATIAEAFEDFLDSNDDKHEKTIYGYNWFFKKFSDSFNVNQPCTVLNKREVERWLKNLKPNSHKKSTKPQKNTVHNYFKILNKFLRFLFEESYLPSFKINTDLKPKAEVKPIIVFRKQHLSKILTGLNNKNTNFRTAMFLMIYTGLRPSDIINIYVKDIDLEEMTLKYYSEKIGETNVIPLHKNLKPVLSERIEEVVSGRIFHYTHYSGIGKAYRRFLKELNLENEQYTLRTLRKNFATTAYENDISITSAALLLGHRNISTTMKYYTLGRQKKLTTDVNKMKFDEEGE